MSNFSSKPPPSSLSQRSSGVLLVLPLYGWSCAVGGYVQMLPLMFFPSFPSLLSYFYSVFLSPSGSFSKPAPMLYPLKILNNLSGKVTYVSVVSF